MRVTSVQVFDVDCLIHEHHTNALKPWNVELCASDPRREPGSSTFPTDPASGSSWTTRS